MPRSRRRQARPLLLASGRASNHHSHSMDPWQGFLRHCIRCTFVFPFVLWQTAQGSDTSVPDSTSTKVHALTSTAQWDVRKSKLREEWLRILGTPPASVPLRAQIVSSTHERDHIRQLVRYQVESGIYADAYVLIPNNLTTSAPAAIVF